MVSPAAKTCSTTDVSAAKDVSIKTDFYDASKMISPTRAKLIALCVVPGQIGSGEMNMADGRVPIGSEADPYRRHRRADRRGVVVEAVWRAARESRLAQRELGAQRKYKDALALTRRCR